MIYTKKQNNRRYYLHRCLKKLKNVSVKAKKRTIYMPFDMERTDKMKELQQLNYSIQTEIY